MVEIKTYTKRWRNLEGTLLGLRPIEPGDVALLGSFFQNLSHTARFQRFHCDRRHLSLAQLQYLSRVNAERHIAFMVCALEGGQERMVAEARCVGLSEQPWKAEYAIVVDEAWQRQGIGRQCMQQLIAVARAYGFQELVGDVVPSNLAMRRFLQAIDFDCVLGADAVMGACNDPTHALAKRPQLTHWQDALGANP